MEEERKRTLELAARRLHGHMILAGIEWPEIGSPRREDVQMALTWMDEQLQGYEGDQIEFMGLMISGDSFFLKVYP